MTPVRLRVVPAQAGPARVGTVPPGAASPAAISGQGSSDWFGEPGTWTARAVCAGSDPDALFVTGAAQRDAARMCAGCPVKLECLADALDHQVEYGVWGGMTERQRRALLRKSPDVVSWRELLEDARRDAIRTVAS